MNVNLFIKMITGRTRKWGGSIGLLIRREDAERLNLKEGEEVFLDVTKKESPLKELWGFGKGKTKRTTEELIKRAREELKAD